MDHLLRFLIIDGSDMNLLCYKMEDFSSIIESWLSKSIKPCSFVHIFCNNVMVTSLRFCSKKIVLHFNINCSRPEEASSASVKHTISAFLFVVNLKAIRHWIIEYRDVTMWYAHIIHVYSYVYSLCLTKQFLISNWNYTLPSTIFNVHKCIKF